MSGELHKFRDDLNKRPPRGSSAPPRTIRAADLDENFQKVSIIPPDDNKRFPSYQVERTAQGTRLKNLRVLPDARDGQLIAHNGTDWVPVLGGNQPGDMLVWVGNTPAQGAWSRLRPPGGNAMHHVLYWDADDQRWKFISGSTEGREKLLLITQNGKLTT
jgi:hypothetical protein